MTTAGYSEPWLFVDGYGVSRQQGVKLTEVGDGTAVKARSELAIIKVDIHDIADVI